jgi:hypothetical protein
LNSNKDPESFSPDGLTEQIIDVLLSEVDVAAVAKPRPTSALMDGRAAQRRYRRQARRSAAAMVRALPLRVAGPDSGSRPHAGRRPGYGGWSGSGGMSPTDVHGTRPGGPNRQERDHRVGTPESLTDATKETGMLQVHTCVSVHCGQCGDSVGGLGFEAHYPTEDAALDAAAGQGWRVGPGGRLWCSACAPVLTCEVEGHEFSAWRHPRTERGELLGGSQYRHCRRCCLHESRPSVVLAGDVVGLGEAAAMGEVA